MNDQKSVYFIDFINPVTMERFATGSSYRALDSSIQWAEWYTKKKYHTAKGAKAIHRFINKSINAN